MSMTRTTLLFIRKTLADCAHCPGFHGAVLSTPEGLVLASSGLLDGDEPAACASGLAVNAGASLGLLGAAAPTEMLVWGQDKLWNLSVLAGDYLLLVASTDLGGAERLRETARRAGGLLNQALRILA